MSELNKQECLRALYIRKWDIQGSGCWYVRGACSGSGYVQIGSTRRFSAHRAAYTAWVGPIPEGLVVRHKCDNKRCVNPEHLEVGTHVQNMGDAVMRDRMPRGERHHQAKLTVGQAREIVHERNKGVGSTDLAERYGVSREVVKKIVAGRLWSRDTADIERNVPKWKGQAGARNGSAKLTAEKVLEIAKLHKDGEGIQDIANEFRVTYQTVWNVIRGKTWTSVTAAIMDLN